jgi:hypothetical protein
MQGGLLNWAWGRRQPPVGVQLNRAHPLVRGLLYYWPLNEGAGVTSYNLANPNYSGTLGSDLSGTPTWRATDRGWGVNFNQNTGEYKISCGTGPSIKGLSAYSITAWFTVASLPSNGDSSATTGARSIYFESKNVSGNVRARILLQNNNSGYGSVANTVTFRWRNDDAGSATNLSAAANSIAVGGRYRVVAALDVGVPVVNLYVNGTLAATSSPALSAVSNTTPADPVQIGDATASEWFDGIIADVRVYNRALQAVEVAQDYERPFDIFLPPRRAFLALPSSAVFSPRRRSGGRRLFPDPVLQW